MLTAVRNFFRWSAPKATRSFNAANGSRLTLDWIMSPLSADAELNGKLLALRSRSRDLERNNEWARGFFRTLENNVIGEPGISLQMRVRDPGSPTFDEIANDKIETAWYQWGRVGKCTVCGRHSWRDVQRLLVRSLARDGEILIRKMRRADGLRLQIIEADILDEAANFTAPNGNEVRFGVECNNERRPVAYHLLGRHPGDGQFGSVARTDRTRIPADEIIHLFITERSDQSRGLPWLVASMQGMKMLDGYAEAELVAARTGAAKMGFFTKKTPEGWDGEVDGDGNLSMDASPGTIEELPAGVEFKEWSTDHPNSGYGDFVKSRLRGIATSLGISYNTLASDLEGVNYSSIRAGLIEEREVWKAIQRFLIEHCVEDIFTEWLSIELLSGRLGLPFEKIIKFNAPEFQGKRWAWVDPKKDMEASILGIRSGQTSLRKVVSEQGGDIYDVLRSIKADNDLAALLGVSLPELEGDSGGPSMEIDPESGTIAVTGGKGKKPESYAQDAAAAAGEIQSTGMNGAQIASLIALATDAAAGKIPVESAKAIASNAFPLVPVAEINKIFDSMKGFEPKPPPDAAPSA